MRFALVPCLAAIVALSPAGAARVPFVGCEADGQVGPVRAPTNGSTPDLPAADAARLAFYEAGNGTDAPIQMGVLAPRGWHCFATYGSNGSSLFVTPSPISWKQVTGSVRLRGPAVQLRYAVGDTSGRFEVAEIAARLFPAAHDYVERIEGEDLLDKPLDRRPFPTDRVTHRGPYGALFTTPANATGLGTQSRLAPDALPIDGVALLSPHDDMSLHMLVARLAPRDRPLVAHIIADVEKRR